VNLKHQWRQVFRDWINDTKRELNNCTKDKQGYFYTMDPKINKTRSVVDKPEVNYFTFNLILFIFDKYKIGRSLLSLITLKKN